MLSSFVYTALKGPLADLLDLRGEALFSDAMDRAPIQDPFLYRAKRLGLKIASLLIDPQGELNQGQLAELNRLLAETPFILGPGREGDALIYGHLKRCLHLLAEEKEIWGMIRKFSPPLCHKKGEEVVQDTLWPEPIRRVQTAHVRKAVISAWLTLLRQATGSCFATAPALLIQQQDPLRFFKDLYDLLSTGQLKRTIGGREYSVPLSLSAGKGDLQKGTPFLERSPGIRAALEAVGVQWTAGIEQKIKDQAARTAEELFRSLLLEREGLTEELLRDEEHLSRMQMAPLLAKEAVYYQKPSERSQKVSEWKKKWAAACKTFYALTECALLRTWEYTLASLSDVKIDFARWNLYVGLGIHPDHKGGVGAFLYHEIDGRLQACNREVEKLAREYEEAVGAMQALERMLEGASSEMRRNQLKAEWMTQQLAAHSLLNLRNHARAKGEQLVHIFSSLIEQYDQKLQHSFQELFDPTLLEEKGPFFSDSSAGFRLIYKHGRLDSSQWTAIYTPEEYIHCLRSFFADVENDLLVPPELGREFLAEITTALIQFIQTPEFLAAAIDRSRQIGRRSPWDYISGGTLQSLLMAYSNRDRPFTEKSVVPHSEKELLDFLSQIKGETPLLMHSPTHAFVLLPNLSVGSLESPKQKWDPQMQEHLARRVSERLPEEEKALFLHLYQQRSAAGTNALFRTHLIESLGAHTKQKEALVDSVLYQHTPLYSAAQAKQALRDLWAALAAPGKIEVSLEEPLLSSHDLYQITKELLLQATGKALSSIDWDQKIAETMGRLGLSRPPLLLFGDTNWSAWFFGFVVNPATGNLQLWRLNRNGTYGFPMSDWKEWFDPKNTTPWIVLSQPKEYL